MSIPVRIYLIVLFIGCIVGIKRYYRLAANDRYIVFLLAATLISEIIAQVLKFYEVNRNPVYHIYSFVEISLISIFFLTTIFKSPSRGSYFLILLFWLCIITANIIYFEPITVFNRNMLLIESFFSILMALYALFKLSIKDEPSGTFLTATFWLWLLLLFYWADTYFHWGLKHLLQKFESFKYIILFHSAVNILFYAGIAVVLYNAPTLKRHE